MTPPDDVQLTAAALPSAPSDSPMLSAALQLVELWGARIALAHCLTHAGVCDCPRGAACDSPAKHPIGAGWQARATADPDELRRIADNVLRYNIAIATGRIVALDVDGPAGEASLAMYPALPRGPRVRTARGWHAYFYVPFGIVLRNRAGARGRGLGAGLDLRAEGGFVIVPPSVHATGVVYEWLPGYGLDLELPEVPEWIVERARDVVPTSASTQQQQLPVDASASRSQRWASGAFERELEAVRSAAKGGRNQQLNTSAFNLAMIVAGGQLDAGEVKRALLAAAQQCGLSEFEAEKTLRSAWAAGLKRDPRTGPTRELPGYERPTGAPATSGAAWEPPGPCDDAPPPAKQVRIQLLADTVERQLQPVGARQATNIPTLDKALRGGFPMRRRVVLQGPPGSGKTTLLVELMHRFSLQSVSCVWFAADETAAGVVTRLGQLAGFSRESLENEGADGTAARSAFATTCKGQPIVVLDPDEGVSTIEDAARVLEQLEPDGPRVLFVDSLQTAACAAAQHVDSLRERIDTKLGVLKGAAQRGTLVFAASEVSRGAYRSQDRSQHIDPLAAGKESGGIEYGVDVLLSMSSVRGSNGLIDVVMPKNRLGEKLPFRLRQDFTRASFAEVELPDPDAEQLVDASPAQLEGDARALAGVVAGNIGCGSRELREAIKRLGLKWGPERIARAQKRLERGIDSVQLVNAGTPKQSKWTLAPLDEGAEKP